MTEKPWVTVIIRTRDRPETLAEAVRSVAQQDYRGIELVVVNDGGQDVGGCVRDVAGGAITACQYLARAQHEGRAAAANAGLEAANGEYIVFLDDDDWILPGHVGMLASALDARPDAVAAYGNVHVVRGQADRRETLCTFAHPFDRLRLAYENFMPIHSVVFRRHVVATGRCRFPPLDHYEDWAFWLQVTRLGDFVHVDQVVACYRADEGSGFGIAAATLDPEERKSRLLAFVRWARTSWSDEQLVALVESSSARAACVRDLHAAAQMQDRTEQLLAEAQIEREAAVAMNASLMRSRSWQLTAPLRALRSAVGNLFAKR